MTKVQSLNLPEWDGQDHVAKLASYVSTGNKLQWENDLKEVLINAMKVYLEKGIKPKPITFISSQGTGKTTFVNYLLSVVPDSFRKYFEETNDINIDRNRLIFVYDINWNCGQPGGYFDVDIKQVWAQAKAMI